MSQYQPPSFQPQQPYGQYGQPPYGQQYGRATQYGQHGELRPAVPAAGAARQGADGTAIGIPETTNNGPAYVTVRASDGLVEFTGDCTWSPAS